jgi:hypothetical protein
MPIGSHECNDFSSIVESKPPDDVSVDAVLLRPCFEQKPSALHAVSSPQSQTPPPAETSLFFVVIFGPSTIRQGGFEQYDDEIPIVMSFVFLLFETLNAKNARRIALTILAMITIDREIDEMRNKSGKKTPKKRLPIVARFELFATDGCLSFFGFGRAEAIVETATKLNENGAAKQHVASCLVHRRRCAQTAVDELDALLTKQFVGGGRRRRRLSERNRFVAQRGEQVAHVAVAQRLGIDRHRSGSIVLLHCVNRPSERWC